MPSAVTQPGHSGRTGRMTGIYEATKPDMGLGTEKAAEGDKRQDEMERHTARKILQNCKKNAFLHFFPSVGWARW